MSKYFMSPLYTRVDDIRKPNIRIIIDDRVFAPDEVTISMDPIDGTTLETSTRIDPFRALDKIDKPPKTLSIKEVIFNPPATIVFWSDNTKTVVKCDYEYEEYDPEKGIAMAIAKKLIGDNKRDYYNVFRHWMKKWENKDE